MARDLIKSDLSIKALQAKDKPYRLNDGKGLFILVNPDGSKYWRFNYSFQNKRKKLSLGVYPETGLKVARNKAAECREQILHNIDPSQSRKDQKQAVQQSQADQERIEHGIPLKNSFTEVSNLWLAAFEHTVSPSTFYKTSTRIKQHILPYIGDKLISNIKSPDILEIILPIAARQTLETAHRVLNHCNRIFKYAVAHGLIEHDPSQAVIGSIPPAKVKHRAAITEPRKIGQLMRDIDNYTGTYTVQCALKLSPLIFCRPGELRQMEWQDIDFTAKEWRYFVTKTETEQIVPLSTQSIAVLKEIQKLTHASCYVFPSIRNNKTPMSNNTVRLALRTMGYDAETMSAHGFRTTASTLLNEQGWSPDAIERQLAHSPKNKVRAAYNRALYLEERVKMMQAWGNYLDSLKAGADIIPFRRKA